MSHVLHRLLGFSDVRRSRPTSASQPPDHRDSVLSYRFKARMPDVTLVSLWSPIANLESAFPKKVLPLLR
jgi:hypothetical protein